MSYSIIPQSSSEVNYSIIIAENAYRTLQNGVFENGKSIFCDIFSDSNGQNNTVNTGSSTATYDATNDYYANAISEGSQLGSTDTATYTDGGGSGSAWILVQTYSSINAKLFKWTNVKRVTSNTLSAEVKVKYVYTDATSAENSGDLAWTSTSWSGTVNYLNPNPSKTVDYVELYCRQSHSSYDTQTKDQKYYALSIASGGTVVANANTITLGDNENYITMFADSTIPTGTEIVFDITDGTTTISDCALDTLVDISALSSGTASVTFKLNSTDDQETAFLYGYSAIIVR
jgi:hypothetical protein